MRIFLKKLLCFLMIIIVLQLILRHKVPKEIKLIDRAVSGKMDIVFFCDSTNFVYSMQDTDQRTISQMLQGLISEREILTIDHGAFSMDIYLAFCNYIIRSGNKPNVVIISVNMRSFSPAFDQRPNWQFEEERFFLNYPLLRPFFKPLAVFKAVSANEINLEQYNGTSVYCDEELVGTVQEFDFVGIDPNSFTDEHLRKICIFQYMYSLKPDHRKLQSMLEIIKTLDSAGVKPLFYITPLNMEIGQKYLPGRFCDRVCANVELIKTLLRSLNIELLDLSQSLPAADFSSTIYPDEHLNQHGRFFVADCLSKILQSNKP